MCVKISYKGRFGNHMFQYVIARLFAEKHNLPLCSKFQNNGIVSLKEPDREITPCCREEIVLTDVNYNHASASAEKGKLYNFDGWFQDWRFYWAYRDRIKSWFEVVDKSEYTTRDTDVVMHVRLKDYFSSWGSSRVIHPDWYNNILDKISAEYACIITDDLNSKYFKAFRDRYVSLFSWNDIKDFKLLFLAKTMIMSNSTFAWWAYFLGNGEKAYTFRPGVGEAHVKLVDFPGAICIDGKYISKEEVDKL